MRILNAATRYDDPDFAAVGIGGGDTGAILGISPYSTAYELWEIKTGKKPKPDLSGQFQIEKGNRLEPIARAAYEELTGFVVSPVFCIDGWRKAALDGYSEVDNHIIEIKFVGAEIFQRALDDGYIPPHYVCQCDHYYLVTGAMSCDFVVVNPAGDIAIVEHARDEKRIQALAKAEEKFYKAIIEDNPPKKTGSDIDPVNDNEFPILMARYEAAVEAEKLAKATKDMVRARLLAYSIEAKRSVEGVGGKVTRFWQEGKVNTKKYLEDNALTVGEDYRGRGSWRFKITPTKRLTVGEDYQRRIENERNK